MARGLNSIYLAGTLTQAPELRYTPGGLAILELNVGGNDHVLGDDGVERDLAWYHRATVFAAQAESLANQLQDASPVFIEGALSYRSWEDQSGQRKSSLDIKALRVELMSFGARKGEPTATDSRGQHRLMNAMNQVMLIGNLTRDAELRYTPSGAAVSRFSVAVNERWRGRDGQDQEKTHYVDINVWRDLAEGAANLSKGDPVFATGRLVNDSWTDKDGNRRYSTRVEGSRVEFLTRGPGSGGADTRPAPAQAAQSAQKSQTPPSQLDIDEEFPPEEDLPF